MLDRKSASEEPEDLPPEEEEPPCPAEAAPPRSLGSSASLVARAMGEATMMSDWKRSENSLRGREGGRGEWNWSGTSPQAGIQGRDM